MSRVAVEWRSCDRKNYDEFCKLYPHIRIGYSQWVDVLYTFNYAFRDYVLESGQRVKMPWGVGDFAISKKKRRARYTCKDGHEFLIMPIDWKKTKEKGTRVFNFNLHTDGYGFKWKWFPKTARFKYADVWYFKPSRVSSRMVSHYVNQEEYKHKYQEWELL